MELMASAHEVIVSWPQRRGDEPLRPSPLIANLPLVAWPEEDAADAWRDMQNAGKLEKITDAQGPPLSDPGKLRGGTRLFTDQSNCAFRAFAIHRLGAINVHSPGEGIDARTRGILVHRVLEGIWRSLESRHALAALDSKSRHALIAANVAEALASVSTLKPSVFTERFTQIEGQRLEALMHEWLAQEQARPDFKVLAREQTVSLNVSPITVIGKLDRVDELADGTLVVIDYKTGDINPKDWLGDRPRDPQLPLYSLNYDKQLGGLLLARVNRHRCAWAGVVVNPELIPGTQASHDLSGQDLSWDALRAQWSKMAEGLAAAIMAGDASVDPLPKACDYCHLAGLCRVNEDSTNVFLQGEI